MFQTFAIPPNLAQASGIFPIRFFRGKFRSTKVKEPIESDPQEVSSSTKDCEQMGIWKNLAHG